MKHSEEVLKVLQQAGLIERFTNARQEPVFHWYALTPLGREGFDALREIVLPEGHCCFCERPLTVGEGGLYLGDRSCNGERCP